MQEHYNIIHVISRRVGERESEGEGKCGHNVIEFGSLVAESTFPAGELRMKVFSLCISSVQDLHNSSQTLNFVSSHLPCVLSLEKCPR